jgi:hypothetical protein
VGGWPAETSGLVRRRIREEVGFTSRQRYQTFIGWAGLPAHRKEAVMMRRLGFLFVGVLAIALVLPSPAPAASFPDRDITLDRKSVV